MQAPGGFGQLRGAPGEVWILEPNGSPSKWDGNNWRAIGGGGFRIAVDPSGNPWVANQGNQIWRWKATSWEKERLRSRRSL